MGNNNKKKFPCTQNYFDSTFLVFFNSGFWSCSPLLMINVFLRCEQKYKLQNPIIYFSFPHKRKIELLTDDKGRNYLAHIKICHFSIWEKSHHIDSLFTGCSTQERLKVHFKEAENNLFLPFPFQRQSLSDEQRFLNLFLLFWRRWGG